MKGGERLPWAPLAYDEAARCKAVLLTASRDSALIQAEVKGAREELVMLVGRHSGRLTKGQQRGHGGFAAKVGRQVQRRVLQRVAHIGVQIKAQQQLQHFDLKVEDEGRVSNTRVR